MYVLANSIHSLQQYGVLEPPPVWQIFLFAIVLIVLTSWLLTRLHSFWAMLISVAVFIIILIWGLVKFCDTVSRHSIAAISGEF